MQKLPHPYQKNFVRLRKKAEPAQQTSVNQGQFKSLGTIVLSIFSPHPETPRRISATVQYVAI